MRMVWYREVLWPLSALLLVLSERLLRISVALTPYKSVENVQRHYLQIDPETVYMVQHIADADKVGPEDVIGNLVFSAFYHRFPERFIHETEEAAQ